MSLFHCAVISCTLRRFGSLACMEGASNRLYWLCDQLKHLALIQNDMNPHGTTWYHWLLCLRYGCTEWPANMFHGVYDSACSQQYRTRQSYSSRSLGEFYTMCWLKFKSRENFNFCHRVFFRISCLETEHVHPKKGPSQKDISFSEPSMF